jgi:ribosomal protein S27AE
MKVSERTIDTSGQIVLECSGCGERVILLGHEVDWSREHRRAFECSGCTKTVTLADRIDGAAYTMKSLLRSSIRPLNSGMDDTKPW